MTSDDDSALVRHVASAEIAKGLSGSELLEVVRSACVDLGVSDLVVRDVLSQIRTGSTFRENLDCAVGGLVDLKNDLVHRLETTLVQLHLKLEEGQFNLTDNKQIVMGPVYRVNVDPVRGAYLTVSLPGDGPDENMHFGLFANLAGFTLPLRFIPGLSRPLIRAYSPERQRLHYRFRALSCRTKYGLGWLDFANANPARLSFQGLLLAETGTMYAKLVEHVARVPHLVVNRFRNVVETYTP